MRRLLTGIRRLAEGQPQSEDASRLSDDAGTSCVRDPRHAYVHEAATRSRASPSSPTWRSMGAAAALRRVTTIDPPATCMM